MALDFLYEDYLKDNKKKATAPVPTPPNFSARGTSRRTFSNTNKNIKAYGQPIIKDEHKYMATHKHLLQPLRGGGSARGKNNRSNTLPRSQPLSARARVQTPSERSISSMSATQASPIVTTRFRALPSSRQKDQDNDFLTQWRDLDSLSTTSQTPSLRALRPSTGHSTTSTARSKSSRVNTPRIPHMVKTGIPKAINLYDSQLPIPQKSVFSFTRGRVNNAHPAFYTTKVRSRGQRKIKYDYKEEDYEEEDDEILAGNKNKQIMLDEYSVQVDAIRTHPGNQQHLDTRSTPGSGRSFSLNHRGRYSRHSNLAGKMIENDDNFENDDEDFDQYSDDFSVSGTSGAYDDTKHITPHPHPHSSRALSTPVSGGKSGGLTTPGYTRDVRGSQGCLRYHHMSPEKRKQIQQEKHQNRQALIRCLGHWN